MIKHKLHIKFRKDYKSFFVSINSLYIFKFLYIISFKYFLLYGFN